MGKVKIISDKIITVWKSKILFRRAIYTLLLGAALTGLIFGSHNCETKTIKYHYTSPVEAWKGVAQ